MYFDIIDFINKIMGSEILIKNRKVLSVVSLLIVIVLLFSSCDRIKSFFSKNKEEESSTAENVEVVSPEADSENNTLPDDMKDILEIDGTDTPIDKIIEITEEDSKEESTTDSSSESSSKVDSKVDNNKSLVSEIIPPSSISNSENNSSLKETTEEELNKKLTNLASEVFSLINKEREEAGIPLLIADDTLSKAATIRGKEAILNPDLGHTRPDSTGAHTVLGDVGYEKSGVIMGENLVFTSYNASAQKLVELWRNSPDHYSNYMDADYIYTGISLSYDSSSDLSLVCAQIFTN